MDGLSYTCTLTISGMFFQFDVFDDYFLKANKFCAILKNNDMILLA